MKIMVEYAVPEKVRDMNKKTREVIRIITRKYVVGCVKDVTGENKFLFKFKYEHMREMINHSLLLTSAGEELVFLTSRKK